MNIRANGLSAFVSAAALFLICSPLSSAVIAHWAFDEGSGATVADSSGNSLNGSLVGGYSWVADPFGNAGQAIGFDGSSGWMDVSDSLKGSSMTFAAWIKMDAIPGSVTSPAPIITAETGSGQASGFCYRFAVASGGGLQLEVIRPYTASGSATAKTAGGLIVTDSWYYVTGVFGDGDVSIYINGEYVAGTTYTASISTLASIPVAVGHLQNWSVQWFGGSMDDIRIYDEALDAAAVSALYQSVPEPATAAVMAGMTALLAAFVIRRRRA
ncbi:MAG: LamG domain-containing protein [Opitutales bacterium]|jgi:hypothetical protein